jgi:hypothetical protein
MIAFCLFISQQVHTKQYHGPWFGHFDLKQNLRKFQKKKEKKFKKCWKKIFLLGISGT